ncbi:hypothetical protein FRC19_000160 [Serendipita sp. 401]|nr:hypothetical protein FRC19_000160 [Serendipita sp. 401]KAG9058704.1 hypothetical protein FS842_006041 [Serendipita sp. 407]
MGPGSSVMRARVNEPSMDSTYARVPFIQGKTGQDKTKHRKKKEEEEEEEEEKRFRLTSWNRLDIPSRRSNCPEKREHQITPSPLRKPPVSLHVLFTLKGGSPIQTGKIYRRITPIVG